MKNILYLIIFITFIPHFVCAYPYEKEKAEIEKEYKNKSKDELLADTEYDLVLKTKPHKPDIEFIANHKF